MTAVYPRVGGGNTMTMKPRPQPCGLSPRGRGKHLVVVHKGEDRGSIPAWAGETGGG